MNIMQSICVYICVIHNTLLIKYIEKDILKTCDNKSYMTTSPARTHAYVNMSFIDCNLQTS